MRRDALYDAPKSSLLGMYSFADRGQTQLWSFKSSENHLTGLLKPIPFSTVGINPILRDLQGPGTSKLDWRYLEHNRIDRNELQIRINSQKGTGTKMAEKLNNFEKFETPEYQLRRQKFWSKAPFLVPQLPCKCL